MSQSPATLPPQRPRGLFFAFEGPDGSGKTTLSKMLKKRLVESRIPATWESFPGKTDRTLGALVYLIHHDAASVGVDAVTPSAVQTLHVAAHLDAIESRLQPHLKSGQALVLDRFWWSTWVYGSHGNVERLSSVIDRSREADVGGD